MANEKQQGRFTFQAIRDVLVVIILLAAIPFAIFAIVMSLTMSREVKDLKQVNSALLQEVSAQRKVAEKQLQINQMLLDISQQQLDINKSLLGNSKDTNSKLSESLGLQRQLLTTAQATLQQTRQINSKTPNAQRLNTATTIIP